MAQRRTRLAAFVVGCALTGCASAASMQAAWLEKPTRAGLRGYESFQWSIDYWAHPHINNYLSADWEFTATGGTAY